MWEFDNRKYTTDSLTPNVPNWFTAAFIVFVLFLPKHAHAQLPPGWSVSDVGSATGGAATFNNGSFTVSGGGTWVWGASDSFTLLYRFVSGDVTIVARLASFQAASPDAEVGLMVRESLAANSRTSFIRLTASGWLAALHRANAGAMASSQSGGQRSTPLWLKLERSGATVLLSYSADGSAWTLLRSEQSAIAPNAYVGIAVAAGGAGTNANATVTDVSVSSGQPPPPPPNQPPTVSLTTPADGATYTAPASITLSAIAADSDGSVTQVDFFNGAMLIGSDTSSPYSIAWNNVPAGGYSLSAVARDNAGSATLSASHSVTVSAPSNQPPTISLTSPADGATFTAPASITVSATAADADGNVTQVDFFNGATLIGSDTSSPYSIAWNNVPAGTYPLNAVARDNAGATTASTVHTIDVSASSVALPSGWSAVDINNPAAGTASFSNGTFSITGAGTGVWGGTDQLAFVYRAMTGDGAIVARLASSQSGLPDAEAGVMIRESLAPNARVMFLRLTGSGWLASLNRAAAGQYVTSTYVGGKSTPLWLKVERQAGTLKSSYSADGVAWTLLRSEPTAMGSTTYVGLGVSSGSAGAHSTSTFTDVSAGGGGPPPPPSNQPPTVSLTAPANGATFTAPASITLSAAASDSDGTVTQVDFFNGANLIGSDTSNPYSVAWNNVAAGMYALTAVARDNAGASTTSTAHTITVSAPSGTSIFPLRVNPGTRHLVDAQGNPFLVHGDTPWLLMLQLTRADVDLYLENRRLKGFNTILVELIEHYFATSAPRNVYGDAPFLTPGDFSTPNEAYFAHAEYVISKAAEKGILVMVTPAYMGFGGGSQGWYQEMVANGVAKLRTYGQYLAQRFSAYDNILWVHGGDYNPPDRNLLRAIPDGIRDIDLRWLHTFHGARGTSALQFVNPPEPWLQVNNIYTNQSTVVTSAFQEYTRSTMPFFLSEAIYEAEGATAHMVRQQAYQAVLSGASGHLMGHASIWRMTDNNWRWAIDAEGSVTLQYLRQLVESLAWWNLQPDMSGTLLTAGIGTGASRAAAALASDRSFAFIYTPAVRALTVDTGEFTGPRVAARWYDPTSGSYTAIAGSPFTAGPSQTVTPPGNNANGAGDWVLVLETTP